MTFHKASASVSFLLFVLSRFYDAMLLSLRFFLVLVTLYSSISQSLQLFGKNFEMVATAVVAEKCDTVCVCVVALRCVEFML